MYSGCGLIQARVFGSLISGGSDIQHPRFLLILRSISSSGLSLDAEALSQGMMR